MEGRERLYAYCREHGVPHKRLGKLLVATDEDEVRPNTELRACLGLGDGAATREPGQALLDREDAAGHLYGLTTQDGVAFPAWQKATAQ